MLTLKINGLYIDCIAYISDLITNTRYCFSKEMLNHAWVCIDCNFQAKLHQDVILRTQIGDIVAKPCGRAGCHGTAEGRGGCT